MSETHRRRSNRQQRLFGHLF